MTRVLERVVAVMDYDAATHGRMGYYFQGASAGHTRVYAAIVERLLRGRGYAVKKANGGTYLIRDGFSWGDMLAAKSPRRGRGLKQSTAIRRNQAFYDRVDALAGEALDAGGEGRFARAAEAGADGSTSTAPVAGAAPGELPGVPGEDARRLRSSSSGDALDQSEAGVAGAAGGVAEAPGRADRGGAALGAGAGQVEDLAGPGDAGQIPRLGPIAFAGGSGRAIRGFAIDGRAYIVADNVRPEEVRGLILHEVGVHVGMKEMLGPRAWADVLARVEDMIASDDAVRTILDEVKRKGYPDSQQTEEVLAVLVETA